MRKSMKLLSLLLLLLFAVPFMPSEYVRASDPVATVTLDRDTYIFGEGPIIATVKLPIEISEERGVDLLYSDENGEWGISNHGVPGKSGGSDTFTFKIEPRRSGNFHVVLIVAYGDMSDRGTNFRLQPNYEAGEYKLSDDGIHFSADFSVGTPKITDLKYIGEADFENPLVVELSLEDDTNVEAIELSYVSDPYGNTSTGIDVKAIREGNKFKAVHPIDALFNGVLHLDKITFKYNTGVDYVIADDDPDYYDDLFNEQTDLENWNKVLPKEFSYAGAGIDIRVDKEEYPHGSPIKFEVSIEDSLYDRYKMTENYLFIEKIPKPRSGEGQHVRLNWNKEKGIYEATANEFDSSSSDIFRVGAILFDAHDYGEGQLEAWSYLLVENDEHIRFEEVDSNIDDLIENGEENYKELENALEELDPSLPEEKKQIEVIEKLLRDIDTKVKAVEPIVKAEAPKFVFNESNLRALKIEEARDPNVKNVQVEVKFSVKTEEEISELLGENSGVIGLYDLSLVKRVITKDNTETVGAIANEDILEKITLRFPLPSDFPADKIPTVVYVDDEGKISPFDTEVKEEEGVKYLYFETDHFSMYGIMASDSEEEPETPVEDVQIPVETPETPETPTVVEKEVEVSPIDEKEEDTKEVKEEKELDTLPKAGVGFVWMYSVSGMVLMTAGVFGLRKKEEKV